MANMVLRGCALLLLSLALAACNKPADEAAPLAGNPDAAATDAAAPANPAETAAAATSEQGFLSATPAVADCANGTDVTFKWDVTGKPEVANVDIWVGDAADAVLFASGGPTGEQSSGPWVKPGTVFVMRDQSNKQEIDRIVIGGPECPAVPETEAPQA